MAHRSGLGEQRTSDSISESLVGEDLGAARDVPTMEANARRVLDAAWAAGIRYFDAARSYGPGEAFLGRWLEERTIPPAAVTVGSKWGYIYAADWRVDAEVHEVKESIRPPCSSASGGRAAAISAGI